MLGTVTPIIGASYLGLTEQQIDTLLVGGAIVIGYLVKRGIVEQAKVKTSETFVARREPAAEVSKFERLVDNSNSRQLAAIEKLLTQATAAAPRPAPAPAPAPSPSPFNPNKITEEMPETDSFVRPRKIEPRMALRPDESTRLGEFETTTAIPNIVKDL